MAEIVAVEGIHAENVTTWFEENVPGATPPLSFSLITGGRSNLTYKVVDAKQQTYVLRRPPLGLVLECSQHGSGIQDYFCSGEDRYSGGTRFGALSGQRGQ